MRPPPPLAVPPEGPRRCRCMDPLPPPPPPTLLFRPTTCWCRVIQQYGIAVQELFCRFVLQQMSGDAA